MKIFYESFLDIKVGDFLEKANWVMAPYKVLSIESLPNNAYHVELRHAAMPRKNSWFFKWHGDDIAHNFRKITIEELQTKRRPKVMKEYCWEQFDSSPDVIDPTRRNK